MDSEEKKSSLKINAALRDKAKKRSKDIGITLEAFVQEAIIRALKDTK